MNNVKQTFTITIPSKTGYMDLTEDVMECVRRSNIRNGIISISSMHTTASVFTATNDIEALNGYLKYYERYPPLPKNRSERLSATSLQAARSLPLSVTARSRSVLRST